MATARSTKCNHDKESLESGKRFKIYCEQHKITIFFVSTEDKNLTKCWVSK